MRATDTLPVSRKPYSFEAQSEPTIEIVDTPILLDIATKPALRNQVGRDTSPGKTSRVGTQVSNVTSTSVPSENTTKFSTAQWMHGNGPPAGPVHGISSPHPTGQSMLLSKQGYTD